MLKLRFKEVKWLAEGHTAVNNGPSRIFRQGAGLQNTIKQHFLSILRSVILEGNLAGKAYHAHFTEFSFFVFKVTWRANGKPGIWNQPFLIVFFL